MMVAYLRGVLRPSTLYGPVSRVTEAVILELVAADLAAQDYSFGALLDAGKFCVTDPKALREAAASADARMRRSNELRFGMVFGEDKVVNKSMPSLYQLYQIAQKHGIMDALKEYNPPTRALLKR